MKNEPCAYCGENKWENQTKHFSEFMVFMSRKFEEVKSVGEFLNYEKS